MPNVDSYIYYHTRLHYLVTVINSCVLFLFNSFLFTSSFEGGLGETNG